MKKMDKRSFIKKNVVMFLITLLVFTGIVVIGSNKKRDNAQLNNLNYEEETNSTADKNTSMLKVDKKEEKSDKENVSENSGEINETTTKEAATEETITEKKEKTKVGSKINNFERISKNEIQISFESGQNDLIVAYNLERKQAIANAQWEKIAEIPAGAENTYSYSDILNSDEIVQFEYRIIPKVKDELNYEGEYSNVLLASNFMICIDPGHYIGKNAVDGEESYGYCEGEYTLKIGLSLREILKTKYGIDSYMTRETESIILNGKKDINLDGSNIALRGEFAASDNADLFVSLHTNANNENANGYSTNLQPASITKTIILVNLLGCADENVINACNSIGERVSNVNYNEGIAVTNEFTKVSVNNVKEWTDSFNDALNTPGTVLCRIGDNGKDYYGVLRGAASVNKKGIIIEHGMHTTAAMRKVAMSTNLYEKWAEADADGIAFGYGFTN